MRRNLGFFIFFFTVLLGLAWSSSAQAQMCINSNISITPSSQDFGTVNIGSSGSRTFTVGYNRMRVVINGVCSCNCSIPASAAVSLSSNDSRFTVSPQSFPVGGSRSVTVTFRPNAETSFSATITGEVTNDGSTHGNKVWGDTVTVTGVGYQPRPNIDFSQTNINFGNVMVNQEGTRSLTVINRGNATLTGSLSASGRFGVTPTSFSIGAGNNQVVTVKYYPDGRGAHNGQLTVSSNDPDAGTLLLALTGVGVAPYWQRTPSGHNFGSIPVGENQTETFTISNLDEPYSTTLNLISVEIFEIDGDPFSLSGPGTVEYG